jgi:sec-independent protein translocase protein TatB
MFDISWGELVLIGMVALIVIGPKELPTVLRTVGHWMTKIRRMASEFQGQFQEAMREAEFADLKKQVDSIADPTKSFADYNPLETARREFESALDDKPTAPVAGADPLAAADAPPAPPADMAETGVDTTTSPSTLPSTGAPTEPDVASTSTSSADVPKTPENASAPAEPVPAATQSDVGGGRAA